LLYNSVTLQRFITAHWQSSVSILYSNPWRLTVEADSKFSNPFQRSNSSRIPCTGKEPLEQAQPVLLGKTSKKNSICVKLPAFTNRIHLNINIGREM